MTALDRLEAALASHGCDPQRRGDHIDALCPIHDDHDPSLDIDLGKDGRALIICRVGCDAAEIIAALGLTFADLFDDEPRNEAGKWELLASYPYRDADGVVIAEKRKW